MGEVTSRYDRHAVGITWHDVRSQKVKNYGVVYIKLNQLVYENVHTITDLPIKYDSDSDTVTELSLSLSSFIGKSVILWTFS